MIFENIAQVEAALKPYVARANDVIGRDITTERTLQFAQHVGSPHERLRVIHIAGTSGKTSTSYYIRALLEAAGKRTGLTVSPHMIDLRDRVQVGGTPLEEAKFCQYFSEFYDLVQDAEDMPTYFELMIVFALWVFDKEQVAYAVLETGLGGMHDSTNICRRPDKLCVITDIGLDHTRILGDTIEAITAQKAGIIAENNAVVVYKQDSTIMTVMEAVCSRQRADFRIILPKSHVSYLERNQRLAIRAYEMLQIRDDLTMLENPLAICQNVQVPGRLQRVQRGESTVIIDGAHNVQMMSALVDTLHQYWPGQRFAVVMAMKHDKDFEHAIELVAKIAHRAIATEFRLQQDAPIKSVPMDVVQSEFEHQDIPCEQESDVIRAIDRLVEADERYILVTGSLYVGSQVLKEML